MEMAGVAFEERGRGSLAAAPLGARGGDAGFLARKSKSSRQLVLHVTEFEFSEGERDASSQQRT